MNTQIIADVARDTLAGTISFPEVVKRLIDAGVEYYHVDYMALRKTFYGDGGAIVTTAITFENLPIVASEFRTEEVRAAILDSQRHGQKYREFTVRVMKAGVQGYFGFLRGQRVTYFGRTGDQHVEWFPGAGPSTQK